MPYFYAILIIYEDSINWSIHYIKYLNIQKVHFIHYTVHIFIHYSYICINLLFYMYNFHIIRYECFMYSDFFNIMIYNN